MNINGESTGQSGCCDGLGLQHIGGTLALAVQPARLTIALIGIVLTFVLGGGLDWAWSLRGGVDDAAISRFVASYEQDRPYTNEDGDAGIFQVWRGHSLESIVGVLVSSVEWVVPGDSLFRGTAVGNFVSAHSRMSPARYGIDGLMGVWWLVRHHLIYFILFGAGSLLIWGWTGGAICRSAALQFSQNERLTAKQALAFSRSKLLGGFVLGPCIPIIFIAITALLLVLGGMLLRVPIFGDLLGGLAFGLSLLGGLTITLLLVGLIAGGSLFWPTIAAEGSDGFDAFSRGLSYVFSKPWRAVLYGALMILFAGCSWIVANVLTLALLRMTRMVVGFGSSWMGWWPRGEGAGVKLEALWPMTGFDALYHWPNWSQLAWYESGSAFLIYMAVAVVVGLMWSFLVSFYFCGSTVIYFLLRRDVDAIDLEDIFLGEEDSELLPVPSVTGMESATSSADTDASAPASGPGPGFGTESPPSESRD